MQGNLNEIDIRSILQLIELGQRTGELFVEAYGINSGSTCGGRDSVRDSLVYRYPYRDKRSRSCDQSWFVFFANGQIIYAANTDTSLSRLRDFLRRYNVEGALDSITNLSISATNALEYGYLWALLENHILSPAQGRSIIQGMVRETLFDLLSLHQGSFIFEMGPALAPQLTTLEIAPLVTKIIKQVQEWKQFHPHIQSPNQCPVISDATQMREALPENTFNNLNRWADGTTNLRQMSRYLNRDILTVARAIYPFVQLGLVQLFYPQSSQNGDGLGDCELDPGFKAPRVICIEDDETVGKAVELILAQYGYEVSALMNPLKALSLVFNLKPDLILCDITMPELDGYEICAMLRHSSVFRQTPIVMLTGKDGFIDRVKARMVGATDYLTKPFGESELLTVVEKYIGPGNPDGPEPDRVLAEVLEAEL